MMLGKKKIAVGVLSVAIASAAVFPMFVSAGNTPGSTEAGAAVMSKHAGDNEDGPRAGFHEFRGFRFHRGGVIKTVLEQFNVDREQFRQALQVVREQFPADERPQFERPLGDEDRAALRAYVAARTAALAEALGIPADEFQAAIDQSRADRMQRFKERQRRRKEEWRRRLEEEQRTSNEG